MGKSVAKIVFSLINLALAILILIILITSGALWWYSYNIKHNYEVRWWWIGWHQYFDSALHKSDDQHDWDVKHQYDLFALYMVCLVGTVFNGILVIILALQSLLLVIFALRGTINEHKLVFSTLGLSIAILVGLVVNVLVFIAHPSALKHDVEGNSGDPNPANNGEYGIEACSSQLQGEYNICKQFSGSEDYYTTRISWGPGPGWILAVVTIPFSIGTIVFTALMSCGNERCCG